MITSSLDLTLPEVAPPQEYRPPESEWDPLAKAAAGGDDVALRELLAMLVPTIEKFCRARIGGKDLSYLSTDDVVQEVCLAVCTALPTYEDRGGSFLYLVRAIATNKVADAFRAVSRDRSVPVAEPPELPPTGNEPEQHALQVDLGERLSRLLSTLPPAHQEILALRVAAGMTSRETAKALGMSPVNVRVTQHRAITRLRALFEPSRSAD
jgi:RNA polymerase sigma-70 factor (ECF subfamily)